MQHYRAGMHCYEYRFRFWHSWSKSKTGRNILLHVSPMCNMNQSEFSWIGNASGWTSQQLPLQPVPAVTGCTHRLPHRWSNRLYLYPCNAWTSHHPRLYCSKSLIAFAVVEFCRYSLLCSEGYKDENPVKGDRLQVECFWMQNANYLLSWHIQYADCLPPPHCPP